MGRADDRKGKERGTGTEPQGSSRYSGRRERQSDERDAEYDVELANHERNAQDVDLQRQIVASEMLKIEELAADLANRKK